MSKKDQNIIIGSCAVIVLGLAGIFTLAVKYGEPSPQRYYYATSDNNNDCDHSQGMFYCGGSGPMGQNGPGGM